MIRSLLACLAVLAAPALAEPARVISGEHANFTRLVIELPAAIDWKVGRTAMGYGFATDAAEQPGYDLSGVWDRIPRSRLQALRADPESGALFLTLACDCHVFPFEYQPGTIVLDVREGPAPPGSVFEAALALPSAPPGLNQPPLVRTVAPYDWLGQPRSPAGKENQAPLFLQPDVAGVSLEPLRDALLLQLSRGAADGIVDMVLPGKPDAPAVEDMGDLSGAIIRIGAIPGIDIDVSADPDGVRTDGCIEDEAINLTAWGDGRSPLDLLAEARAGLYGEFDALSPEATRHAVELHLYLGFGVEALQYGALLPEADTDPNLAALMSMARLIDGESDPASPFASMLDCDGTAALWAALAYSSLPTGSPVNTDAIVRNFQTLPPHLRRHLGPRLAALLLDRDAEAARMIRDATERTPEIAAGTVALMDAEADLQASRPEAALAHAEAAVREDASGLAGLVALVEAHLRTGAVLAPEAAESLRALQDVPEADEVRRDRALTLALALSGQFDAAFAFAGPDNPAGADLWRALAMQADDNAILAHAVLAPSRPVPDVDPDVGLALAVRLAGLGFPEAALTWLGPVDPASTPERRLAAATAQQALGNAREALLLLSGLSSAEARSLQVNAYRQLGAYDDARRALVTAGKAEEGLRLASWDSDWAALQTEGAPWWAEASTLVVPAPAAAAGPLAEGKAALDDSAAARSAIETLLAKVPSPPP